MSLRTAEVGIPVADALYYDFFTPGKMFDWVVSGQGEVRKIPMAMGVAVIDAPSWFPSLGYIETDPALREAAEGVFEVANLLESFISTNENVKDTYMACIRNMEVCLEECDSPTCAISICEETTYELELLVGILQVFGNRQLHSNFHHQVQNNVGVWMSFPGNTYEQNYNLNYVMIRWLRQNWTFPFLSPGDTRHLVSKFGFDATSLQFWLENSRRMVWEPLASGASATICSHIKGIRGSIGDGTNAPGRKCDEEEGNYVALAERVPSSKAMKHFACSCNIRVVHDH